jgi:hypothetical protein
MCSRRCSGPSAGAGGGRGVADAACYTIALIALLLATRSIRTRRSGLPGTAHRRASGFALCLGAGSALVAPTTVAALRHLQPYPGLGVLLGDDTTLLAVYFLGAFALALRDGPRARVVRTFGPGSAAAAVLVANALLFAVAGGDRVQSGYLDSTTARTAIAMYDSVFMLYCFWGTGVFLVCCTRYAAQVGPGMLRTGLHLCSAAAVAGFLWAGWTVSDIVAVLRTGEQTVPEDTTAAVLGSVCAVLALSGATVATWAERMSAWTHWWRSYRAMRRLGPLWRAAHDAVPQVVLGRGGRLAGALPRDARFALYRRVIEIRDAQLALRRYCPPPELMAQLARAGSGPDFVLDDQPPAIAEAADLAVAMVAAGLGRVFGGGARPPRAGQGAGAGQAAGTPRGGRGDLDAETAWLIEVCDAFARSPEVDRIRRRARESLRVGAAQTAGAQ